MYVTDHLPGSTYGVSDDSLRAFGDISKKRNTTDSNMDQRKKRYQSVERGGGQNQQSNGEYLSLNISDQHQYKNYKRRKRLLPPQLQDN